MYHPISISERGIRGEYCPYCNAPTVRVPTTSISTYIPLQSRDIVFQCVCNPQHFISWNSDDIHLQGTIADPYLRACRYLLISEMGKIASLHADTIFARQCMIRYINLKMQNGSSDYLNVQLLDDRDCFKILKIIRAANWQTLIPVAFNETFANQIGPAKILFDKIFSLSDFIDSGVFVSLYEALKIEMSLDIFINRTFEMIDFFRSCGDQFLRVISARCAVCYAHSNSLGFLLIGNQSWNYTSFLFHYKDSKLTDLHDCGSMVHPCQHLPLGSKYSFQRGRIVESASLYN